MNNKPVSKEHTLKRFLSAGWKIIEEEERLIFVQSPKDGIIRLIDEDGCMRRLSAIGNRWEEPKIKKYVENNIKIERSRGKKK